MNMNMYMTNEYEHEHEHEHELDRGLYIEKYLKRQTYSNSLAEESLCS